MTGLYSYTFSMDDGFLATIGSRLALYTIGILLATGGF